MLELQRNHCLECNAGLTMQSWLVHLLDNRTSDWPHHICVQIQKLLLQLPLPFLYNVTIHYSLRHIAQHTEKQTQTHYSYSHCRPIVQTQKQSWSHKGEATHAIMHMRNAHQKNSEAVTCDLLRRQNSSSFNIQHRQTSATLMNRGGTRVTFLPRWLFKSTGVR